MKQDLIKCQECNIHKGINNYYRVIKERLIDGNYNPYVICKDCVKKEYLSEYEKVHNEFKQALLIMCEKYNIYYDDSLRLSIEENNINDGWNLFQQYIKCVSSLFQYQKLKYKDSIFLAKDIKPEDINTDNTIIIKEKSDIEFIDEDIKGIKEHIEYSLKQHDHNAHNKWMNCLRDALELKEKLLLKENKVSINSLNDLKVDYGVFEGKDINGETVGIVPIFINSHYIRSAYIKYVDGKYKMTEYITEFNK